MSLLNAVFERPKELYLPVSTYAVLAVANLTATESKAIAERIVTKPPGAVLLMAGVRDDGSLYTFALYDTTVVKKPYRPVIEPDASRFLERLATARVEPGTLDRLDFPIFTAKTSKKRNGDVEWADGWREKLGA